jgi:hypothetical protein
LAGKEEEINGSSLMWDYVSLMLCNKTVRGDTIRFLMLDQLKGAYFFCCVYLQMYLVDVVLSPPESSGDGTDDDGESKPRRLLLHGIHAAARLLGRCLESEDDEGKSDEKSEGFDVHVLAKYMPANKREAAMVIGALYVAPFILLHWSDHIKCYLAVPCEIRKVLLANLMRQFLNYREEVRNQVKHSQVIMVMMRDVWEIADGGYMKLLSIVRCIGKLCFAMIFILNENQAAAIPLIVYPILLSCWLCIRQRKTIDIHEKKAVAQDEIVESVEYAVEHYNLISDFHLREPVTAKFEQDIDGYHDTEGHACAVVNNNLYAAPWLTTLVVGSYMGISAFLVNTGERGALSLGAFLASINVFKEVGTEIEEIYLECMEVQLSFGPLTKITHYMNLETNLVRRMAIVRHRQK